jgi:Serine hydrolase
MAGKVRRVLDPLYRLAFGPALPEGAADLSSDASQGVVLVVQGVGGIDLCAFSMRYVVKAEGLPYDVFVFHWGHGFGRWFADLTRAVNRDNQARRLAEWINGYRMRHPEKSILIIAKSAGSGVVVGALELLERDVVNEVVLLAPAISPAYDLTRALRAVRGRVTAFWSPFDVIILGAGTRLFGTIDRVRSVGAGLVGFRVPGSGESDSERVVQYDKLRQIGWRRGMLLTGNLGGHFGPDSPVFLRKFVMPLLRPAMARVC